MPNNSISINPIYNQNFKTYLSNVERLEDAEIICIPEYHNSIDCRLRQAWLINKIYRDEDLVLVESSNKNINQVTEDQTSYVARSINIKGWDDKDSSEKYKQDDIYQLFSDQHNKPSSEILSLLKLKIEEAPGNKDLKKTLMKRLKMAEMKSDDCEIQKNLTDKIVYALWKNELLHGKLKKLTIQTWLPRQKSMINTCKANCLKGRKIIILAGLAHLLKPESRLFPYSIDDPETKVMDQGFQILHNYLETKKFIIFDCSQVYEASPELKAEVMKDLIADKATQEPKFHNQELKHPNPKLMKRNWITRIVIRIFCVIFSILLFPLSTPACIFTKLFFPKKFNDLTYWLAKPFKKTAFAS